MAEASATLSDRVRLMGRATRVGRGVLGDRIAPALASTAADVPGSVAPITGSDAGRSTRQELERLLKEEAFPAGSFLESLKAINS